MGRTLGNGGTKNQRVGLVGNVGLENVTGIFIVVVLAFVVNSAKFMSLSVMVGWFCCVYTSRREKERKDKGEIDTKNGERTNYSTNEMIPRAPLTK